MTNDSIAKCGKNGITKYSFQTECIMYFLHWRASDLSFILDGITHITIFYCLVVFTLFGHYNRPAASFCNRMQVKKTKHPNAMYRLEVNVDGENRVHVNAHIRRAANPVVHENLCQNRKRVTIS